MKTFTPPKPLARPNALAQRSVISVHAVTCGHEFLHEMSENLADWPIELWHTPKRVAHLPSAPTPKRLEQQIGISPKRVRTSLGIHERCAVKRPPAASLNVRLRGRTASRQRCRIRRLHHPTHHAPDHQHRRIRQSLSPRTSPHGDHRRRSLKRSRIQLTQSIQRRRQRTHVRGAPLAFRQMVIHRRLLRRRQLTTQIIRQQRLNPLTVHHPISIAITPAAPNARRTDCNPRT